jgi:hypothetical protein
MKGARDAIEAGRYAAFQKAAGSVAGDRSG